MKRYKWFYVGLPSTFQNFKKTLLANPLHDNNTFGFSQIFSDRDRIRFIHFFKSRISIISLDFDGNRQKSFIDTIDSIEFEVFQTTYNTFLRVDEPPRSLRELINNLSIVAGIGFSAEPIIFSYENQIKILRQADYFRMVSFKGLGSDISAKLLVRIEVASKTGADPNQLDFLKKLQYKIDHATFEVISNISKGQITFAATGVIKIYGNLEFYLLECVEKYISNDRK